MMARELLVNCRNGATLEREVPDLPSAHPSRSQLQPLLITRADRALARLRLRAGHDPVIADILTLLGYPP